MGKEAHTGQSGSDASLFLLTTDGTAPRTDYILDWSPGARVGQAWLNVETMNGNGVLLVWERYRDRSWFACWLWPTVEGGKDSQGVCLLPRA